jgi:hypothetical protein
MGIERKEIISYTYTCDRCDLVEEHQNDYAIQGPTMVGWTTANITTYDERFIPTTRGRTLCPGCTTGLQAWFQAVPSRGGAI